MRRGLSRLLQQIRRVLAPSQPRPSRAGRPHREPVAPSAGDLVVSEVVFEYHPERDGDPDPGEVVWTWVPYEDDATRGKDRPVVVVGRAGRWLAGVALTSKDKHLASSFALGRGPWDREGRESFAKLDRLLHIDPATVRREGAVLDRGRYDELVAAVTSYHRR